MAYTPSLAPGLYKDATEKVDILYREMMREQDRTPVSTQNLTVVAKDAILKADTRARLDKCAESLEVRYANRQIPQEDYLDLCELIKIRKEVITT